MLFEAVRNILMMIRSKALKMFHSVVVCIGCEGGEMAFE